MGPKGYLLSPADEKWLAQAAALQAPTNQALQAYNGQINGRDVPIFETDAETADFSGLLYPPTLAQRMKQKGGFAGEQGTQAMDDQVTSLRTEKIGDGHANCLERAYDLAGPNDSVVLLDHTNGDGGGHAVVQAADGSITDPNDRVGPDGKRKTYKDINAYIAAHKGPDGKPFYGNPVAVKESLLQQVFSLPPTDPNSKTPGPRDLLLQKLVATGQIPPQAVNRMVADANSQNLAGQVAAYGANSAPTPSGDTTADLANAIANAPTYSPTELALLGKIKDPEQRAIQELQMQMQKQALLCTVITNLAQMRHDMLKAVAQNLRS
jgi:hypothetical protein